MHKTTEQQDLDAPYVPDGMREFQVGARVRFVRGEREPLECTNCNAQVSLPDIMKDNGQVCEIVTIAPYEDENKLCALCGTDGIINRPSNIYRLGLLGVFHAGKNTFHVFVACANELTLVEEPDEQ